MDWEDIDNDQTTLDGTTFSSSATTDFNHYYLSNPLSHSQTRHETGNKIIMPESALDQLASLTIVYPMLFRIENTATGRHSHCGVVEFTADEGFVYLPTWMMDNMQLRQGDLVNIKNINLPKGEYIKIQPHTTKFTTLSDHKSLLENAFSEFACLTTGDTIMINHENEKYMIDIIETKPSPAILMFETDCEVDFAQPLDYKVHEKKTTTVLKRKNVSDGDEYCDTKEARKEFPRSGIRLGGTVVVDGKPEIEPELEFKAFTGVARRVDGQPVASLETVQQDLYNIQIDVKKINKELGFKAFSGKSCRLL